MSNKVSWSQRRKYSMFHLICGDNDLKVGRDDHYYQGGDSGGDSREGGY